MNFTVSELWTKWISPFITKNQAFSATKKAAGKPAADISFFSD